MITLAAAILVGLGAFAAAFFVWDFGSIWSVVFAFVAFGVVQGVAAFLIQRRVKAEMLKVQTILMNGQKKLQAKMQRWQLRPPGSIKAAQKEISDDTRIFVEAALAQTEGLDRFRPWVPMMDRQIATARLQLCWMIRDFKTVDALLPKALFLEPTMVAMKMARLYMIGAELKDVAKVYAKGVRRVRYNGNVLLAAAMSWMQMQKNDVDGAFRTLTEALKKSDNEVLKRNHECLMNNRPAHFSNSGLGDIWYSLLLEEPRVRMQRARSVYR